MRPGKNDGDVGSARQFVEIMIVQVFFKLYGPGLRIRQSRAARDVAEILFRQAQGLLPVKASAQNKRRVPRDVIFLVESLDVRELRVGKIFHVAYDGVSAGMVGAVHQFALYFPLVAVRNVHFRLALFIYDDALLDRESLGRHSRQKISHAVGFHPHGVLHAGDGNSLMVEGVIDGGPAVHGTAQPLDQLPGDFGRNVLGFREHQMLEKMREPGLALLLPVAADVIKDADSYHGSVSFLAEQDGQAVIQSDFFAA